MKTLLKLSALSSALVLFTINLPIYQVHAATAEATEKAHADHEESEGGHDAHDHHADEEGGHGGHEDAAAEPVKGPNNGRLLVIGDITLELAIFEDGVPPEYRAWVTRAGKAIAPSAAQLDVALTRLGGVKSAIPFKAEGNFLRSTVEVTEPHSFQVDVKLSLDGKPSSWNFDSFEGRTQISAAAANASGMSTAVVGPSAIGETRTLFGQVTLDPDRSAEVRARFTGLVREVNVNTGDVVRKGQVLASVESNDSLRSYSISAPMAGTVMARMTNVGDVAGSEPLFEISDTTNVLVEIRAFGRDAQLLAPGCDVVVNDRISEARFGAKIARVLPKLDPVTRATIALARLAAPSASLRPGTAVSVDVGLSKKTAALSVDVRAIQRFRDWDVVFIQVGDQYEIRPLELGQRDSRFAEVLSGINVGDRYVVEQSFLVKADIEKSGASHDH